MADASRMRRILYGCASALAILFLLGMYRRYSLDFPYADQWEFVPFLEQFYQGRLGLGAFWEQHNEHRLIFPRLLMLMLALPTDWNIYAELAANFVLAFLTWVVLCVQVRGNGAEVHEGDNGPVYFLFTLLLFSLSQWGNWFLGWQLQEFMNVLAAVLAMVTLTWRQAAGTGVALAAVFGVVATYSFANGMLVWPIGAVLLLLQRTDRGAVVWKQLGAWCGVGALVLASYMFRYETPAHHGPLTAALQAPLASLAYILAYLGQPVGHLEDLVALGFELLGHPSSVSDHTFSVLMGVLGLLLWGVTTVQLLVFRVPLRVLLPWLGFALYTLGTAILTAFGRVEEGLDQAVSSRYVTMANLLWLTVIVQSYWVAQLDAASLARRALPWKVGILTAILVGTSLAGAYRWTERYHAFSALRADVQSGNDPDRLRPVYPPAPEVILERRPVLEAYGLSIFGAPPGSSAAVVTVPSETR